ncbi:hypothetical protein [Lewinella cohaerens]|uniref:hypothetical protein n=1 Tax=Lewinella cohaerens TaxID=70995 RepID=UPI00036B9513|nr:hypothetical protein [Lewinella cohaerens]
MSATSKYLFGSIAVNLEPVTETEAEFTHKLVQPGPVLVKADLQQGLCTTLRISPSYWNALPDANNELTDLKWKENPETTVLCLQFNTSPLFDKFSDVIDQYSASLNLETQQDILTGT